MTPILRRRLAELGGTGLALRALHLAHGIGGGSHRSDRRGAGIEFAGHREYSPGDDLRHLDRHALLRHGRHLIREFHTDTERALHVIVDARASMNYSSDAARETKRGRAFLLGAALLVVARRAGDPIGLSLVGGRAPLYLPPNAASDQLERLLDLLEGEEALEPAAASPDTFARALGEAGQRLPVGASVVALGDWLEPGGAERHELLGLTTRRRGLTVAQLLDVAEVEFPFQGPVRLSALGRELLVDTDADRAKQGYLSALAALTEELRRGVTDRHGQFLRLVTSEAPEDSLRRLVTAVRGGAP